MTINKRKKEILTMLIQRDLYIPIKTLTKELGITRSTVYRDIKGINDWLGDIICSLFSMHGIKGFI